VLDPEDVANRETDGSAAAQLAGGAPETADYPIADSTFDPTVDVDAEAGAEGYASLDEDAAADGAWLDDAALGSADVDENALAAAIADDELGDVTVDELAQLEAGLILGGEADEDESDDVDQGEPEL
jgi:hypothetical protein